MKFKHIEIRERHGARNLSIREFEDGEWVGGSYATYDNLVEKVKEALEDK